MNTQTNVSPQTPYTAKAPPAHGTARETSDAGEPINLAEAMSKNFIAIPKPIVYSQELSLDEKALYAILLGFRFKKNLRSPNEPAIGSCSPSIRDLACAANTSKKKIARVTARLEQVGLVRRERDSKGRIIYFIADKVPARVCESDRRRGSWKQIHRAQCDRERGRRDLRAATAVREDRVSTERHDERPPVETHPCPPGETDRPSGGTRCLPIETQCLPGGTTYKETEEDILGRAGDQDARSRLGALAPHGVPSRGLSNPPHFTTEDRTPPPLTLLKGPSPLSPPNPAEAAPPPRSSSGWATREQVSWFESAFNGEIRARHPQANPAPFSSAERRRLSALFKQYEGDLSRVLRLARIAVWDFDAIQSLDAFWMEATGKWPNISDLFKWAPDLVKYEAKGVETPRHPRSKFAARYVTPTKKNSSPVPAPKTRGLEAM